MGARRRGRKRGHRRGVGGGFRGVGINNGSKLLFAAGSLRTVPLVAPPGPPSSRSRRQLRPLPRRPHRKALPTSASF